MLQVLLEILLLHTGAEATQEQTREQDQRRTFVRTAYKTLSIWSMHPFRYKSDTQNSCYILLDFYLQYSLCIPGIFFVHVLPPSSHEHVRCCHFQFSVIIVFFEHIVFLYRDLQEFTTDKLLMERQIVLIVHLFRYKENLGFIGQHNLHHQ